MGWSFSQYAIPSQAKTVPVDSDTELGGTQNENDKHHTYKKKKEL